MSRVRVAIICASPKLTAAADRTGKGGKRHPPNCNGGLTHDQPRPKSQTSSSCREDNGRRKPVRIPFNRALTIPAGKLTDSKGRY